MGSPVVERLPARLQAWLASPRLPRLAPLIGVLLYVPSLFFGFAVDDHWLRASFSSDAAWSHLRAPMPWLFSFYDGDPERTRFVVEHGLAPWWTDPTVTIDFFRPLSAVTHWLDAAAAPQSAAFAHAQSLVWYAALVAVVVRLYRALLPAGPAMGLACLLFALDYGHAVPASWVANRNALVAATFGALAVLAYVRAVRGGRRGVGAVGAALALGLALLGGESGLGFTGYLFAAAVFLDDAPWRVRWATLAPSVVVGVAWLVGTTLAGFGARGSGMYVDPRADPAGAAWALVERLPLLLSSGLGGPMPDAYPFLTPPQRLGIWCVAIVVIGVALVALRGPLRARREARFALLGSVLAAFPAAAVFASSRNLTSASVGTLLLAGLIVVEPSSGLARAYAAWHGLARAALSPVIALTVMFQIPLVDAHVAAWSASLPSGVAFDRGRIVIVGVPDTVFLAYVFFQREAARASIPHALLGAAPSDRPARARRTAPATLEVEVERGFVDSSTDMLLRSPGRPMRAGDRVDLGDVEVEVVRVDERGMPSVARYHFDAPLEDERWAFVAWDGARFVPWQVPAIGQEVALAPRALLDALTKMPSR